MKYLLDANVFVHLGNHRRGYEKIAEAAAVLRDRLQQAGRDIGINDCLTAAHAIATGLVCVTANRKHFDRIDGLIIEDWSAARDPE